MGSIKQLTALAALFITLASVTVCKAQTWDEWFRQKKTQIDYLAKQIAELELYGGYLKQGYRISQNGLGSIRGWAKEELDLHSDYYKSLEAVNPEIKNSSEAASVITYAASLACAFVRLDLSGITEDSRIYINRVKAKVLEESDADIAELQLVLTSGQAGMTDGSRIRRLQGISARMKDRYAFTRSFLGQVKMLQQQEAREGQDIQTLKKYEGIN